MVTRVVGISAVTVDRADRTLASVAAATTKLETRSEGFDEADPAAVNRLAGSATICTFDMPSLTRFVPPAALHDRIIDLAVEARARQVATSGTQTYQQTASEQSDVQRAARVIGNLLRKESTRSSLSSNALLRRLSESRARKTLHEAELLDSSRRPEHLWRGNVSSVLHRGAARGLPVSEDFAYLIKNRFALRSAASTHEDADLMFVIPQSQLHVDARLRSSFVVRPFHSVTGRAQILGSALLASNKLLRGFIEPTSGRALVVADVEAEEHGLVAALAGDERAWSAYASGDYYAETAREAGLAAFDLSTDAGRARRSSVKLALNQLLNGAGIGTVIEHTGLDAMSALALHRCLLEGRTRTLDWLASCMADGRRTGALETRRGWRISTNRSVGTSTLRSFLLQGHGVDLLGDVALGAEARGLELCGTLHDAFIFECAEESIETHLQAFREAFRDACTGLLGAGRELRVSIRVVRKDALWLSRPAEGRFRRLVSLIQKHRSSSRCPATF